MTKIEIAKIFITEYIKSNGIALIDGDVLNTALEKMIAAIPDETVLAGGFVDTLKIADTEPTGGWETGVYILGDVGVYPQGFTTEENNFNIASFNGTDWDMTEIEMHVPENKIETWVPGNYVAGDQRINPDDQSIYQANTSLLSTDIPGISSKWDKVVGGSVDKKVTFNSIVKFDEKRKFSTINQTGDINFTYDGSGTVKESMDKRYIVSDEVSDIFFSSDFDVIGEIDKTKNQEIYFSRPDLVEFKIPAVIINVAKSGQTTPIDLDPDAEIYYNKMIAAGATLSNAEIYAMNNAYLELKSNGIFSKMKGIYWALGNTTASRLLNGVSGRPDATLVSGTVTADGIVGVLDSGMKPLDIFSLDSFAYGIHNTTAIYSNLQSMGCGVSATSGILLICTATSPSGQFLFSGPRRDIYANAANADSLGTYVVSRSGVELAKLFKNSSLLFTHTASSVGGTLPNINFAIGGYNDNGVFSDDGRTTKWAFLSDGLTDTEAVAVGNIFNTLMTAIGR